MARKACWQESEAVGLIVPTIRKQEMGAHVYPRLSVFCPRGGTAHTGGWPFISLNLISEVLHRCAQRLACEVTPRSVKMTASPIAVALNTGHMRDHTVHLGKINFSVKEVKDLNQTNVVTPTMSSGN